MMQKKTALILIVLVAAIGGGLFAMGFFTAEDARYFGRKVYYQGKGTVKGAVETVTTVSATGSGDPQKAAACRGNLQRIEAAKRAAANVLALTVGEVPESEVRSSLGGAIPKCPDGGKYKINPINYTPTCSIGSQTASDPNDDHVLNNF